MKKSCIALGSLVAVVALLLGVGYSFALRAFDDSSTLSAQAQDVTARTTALKDQLNALSGANAQKENEYKRLQGVAAVVQPYLEKLTQARALLEQVPPTDAEQPKFAEEVTAAQELLQEPTLTGEQVTAELPGLDELLARLQAVVGELQKAEASKTQAAWLATLPAKLSTLGGKLPVVLTEECSTGANACFLPASASIGVRPQLQQASEEEQVFALAVAYAESAIEAQKPAISAALMFQTDFNRNTQLLSYCMAATKGATLQADGCTSMMLSWAGEIWNGRVS